MAEVENSYPGGNVKNVFIHESSEELSKVFTELWTQLINEKEGNVRNQDVLQTSVSCL